MTKIGRNDPCPCGSGKKYKKCCLGKDRVYSPDTGDSTPFFTPADRASAIKKLIAFAYAEEFDRDHEIGLSLFWGDCLTGRSEEEIRRLEEAEQTEINFNTWFYFDTEIDNRKMIADLFLAREGDRLRPGERAYLTKALQTHFRLYEVEEVKRDQGFRLKDLWTDQIYRVRERAATHSFIQWDLMATRLMDLGDNDWVIDAGIYNYPPRAKEPFLKELRAEHKRFKKNLPGQDDTAFFKRIGFLFNHWWLDWVVFPPLPQVVTAERDEVVFTRVLFDVRDASRLNAALQSCSEFDPEEKGRYGWIQETPDIRRTLGSLEVQGNRLILETMSKERGERGRQLLEQIAGDAIRYRVTEYQDQKQILKSSPKPKGKTPRTVPPELEAKLLKEFLDKHYQKWLDDEIPALS